MKTTLEIEAVDIQTMHQMGADKYRQYVQNQLLYVDHHDVLRSGIAQYPLAVTREQVGILIAHLRSLETKIGAQGA